MGELRALSNNNVDLAVPLDIVDEDEEEEDEEENENDPVKEKEKPILYI